MAETMTWWRWLLLALFFGALGGVALWARRGAGRFEDILRRSSSRLLVRETRWLANRASVALIEVDGQTYLLAQSPGGVAWQKVEPSRPVLQP